MEAQPECARPRAQQRPNFQDAEQIPRAPSLLPDAAPEDGRTPTLKITAKSGQKISKKTA
jgi:hypothetical protein